MADWYDDRYRGRYGRNRDFDRDRFGYRNRSHGEDLSGSDYGRGYYGYEGDYGYGRLDFDEDRDFYARADYGRGVNPGYGYDDESDEDLYYRNRGITGPRRQFGGYGSRYGGYTGAGRGFESGRSPSAYDYNRQYRSGNRAHNSMTGRGVYGRGNYGRDFDDERERYGSSFGSGYGAEPYYDEEDDFGTGFYDTDYEPGYWTYTEFWLIPGPYSGMGPQGYQRSDERIEDDICERLTRHGQIDASDISVQVQDGIVTLSGSVDSRNAKRQAEDTVETVSGVKDVHNELKVRKGMEQQNQGQHTGQGVAQGQKHTSGVSGRTGSE